MGKLDGKIAIVTGAASGIGRRCAERFAEEGAQVVIGDIDIEGANSTADQIVRNGGRAFALPLDLADRSEEHTSELQSLMRISYAVFCLQKKQTYTNNYKTNTKSRTLHDQRIINNED